MQLGLLLFLLCLLGGAQAGALVTVCGTGCAATTLAAALSVSGAGDEIVLVGGSLHNESSVNITFPLTITAQSPVDIMTAEADTGLAWLTVSSTLTLAGNLTIHSAAVHVVAGGDVRQRGALTITPRMGMGVRVEAGGFLVQQGDLVINAPNNQTIGLFCEGEWLQQGSLQINSSAPRSPCLVDKRGCLESGIGAWFVFGGRWTQNGTVQITCPHIGVAVLMAEWIQNAPVQLSVIANEPPTPLTAAVVLAGGVWKQSAALDVVASQRSAIYVGDPGPGYVYTNLWQQDASVTLHVTSPLPSNLTNRPYVGFEFDGLEIFWNQNADVAIHLDTPSTTSAFNCKAQPLWNVQKGNLSISPSDEFSLDKCVRTLPFASNTSSSSPASEQPVLRFDTTNSTAVLQIVPKAKSEQNPDQFVVVEEATVGLGLVSISEVADNGTRLQTGQVLFAGWSVMANNSVGASQAFVLKSLVVVDNGTSQASAERQCMMEMEVFLFDEATNVSIGDLASFTVLPALTKFAIRISSWPWLSATDHSSRLEVRLAVSPSFTNVTYPSPPPLEGPVPTRRQEASGLTSLILDGQRSSDGKRALTTEVRFVSVVELDGVLQGPTGVGRAPVEFGADVESSSLVLSFGHFAANMSYDPDLGVLVGRRDKDGSSSGTSDDTTWVIAVSIAVPLAVVAVVAVIVVGVVVLAVQKRNRTKQLQKRLSAARKEEDL